MNYTKKSLKPQNPTFSDKYSPEFQELVIDIYTLLKKWSGRRVANAIGEDGQLLDYYVKKGKRNGR